MKIGEAAKMKHDLDLARKPPDPGHSLGASLWLAWVGIALLFVALRWNSYDAPLTRDEGTYAYAAQLLRHGMAPYQHSFLQKPPMMAYSYTLADVIAPNVYWFPRVIAYAFAALATGLLGYTAAREFGAGVSLPAMWLMTPMILMPELDQFIANTEMFLLLPIMAMVATYVRSRHSEGGTGYWLAEGFLGGAAFYYKYTVLPLIVVVFVAASFEEWRSRRSVRQLCICWLFALLGIVVISALALGFFLARDGGKHLWECTVVFNRFYAAQTCSLSGLGLRLHTFWSSWWFLFLTPLLLVLRREPRVWFWALVFLVAWTTTAASIYPHYYILVMPFWALLTAVAIRSFAAWVSTKQPTFSNWLSPAFTAVMVVAVCWPDVRWLMRTKQQFARDKMKTWSVFLESEAVARRVAQLTSTQDYVYVAGSEPQILCYAHRLSSTRFDIVYPLMMPTPLAKSYQLEAIRDLDERPPALIVFVRLNTSWLAQEQSPPDFLNDLAKLLQNSYDLLGGYLIEGEIGHWQEPMARSDFARASLVVFKRRTSS